MKSLKNFSNYKEYSLKEDLHFESKEPSLILLILSQNKSDFNRKQKNVFVEIWLLRLLFMYF